MIRKQPLFVIAVGAVLAGLLTLVPVAASGQGQEKLGGSWLGAESDGGHRWACIHTPLDSAARHSALQVKFTVYSPLMAALIGSAGADSFSDFVGEARMTDRSTAQFTMVGYALKRSQLALSPELKLIFVGFGTWVFRDAEHAVLNCWVNVYPAAADADGDGMPDPGSTPVFRFPITDTSLRVPIMP